jgi:hypothetical protein
LDLHHQWNASPVVIHAPQEQVGPGIRRDKDGPCTICRGLGGGHSLGGLMATYNVSRYRKQKMAALVALEADLLRVVGEGPVCGNAVPLEAYGSNL